MNIYEQNLQTMIAEGDCQKAQNYLDRERNNISPIFQSIFEAYISFAFEEYKKAKCAIYNGLRLDSLNYELYVLLGDYYSLINMQQAYLCYENALFFCDVPEDRIQIQYMLENMVAQGVSVPKVAMVILSYNLLDMTKDCIESIRNTSPDSAREIIVVDNASKDDSVEWLKAQSDIILLCNKENKGFPAACNQGIELADPTLDILLLNNDTVMMDNALFWLRMGLYESEKVGSTGCVTNYVSNRQTVIENGKTLEEYTLFAKSNNVPMDDAYLNKLYLVGFALLIKRTVLNQIGLLDVRFSPGNYEDNDICMRINIAGYRNVLCKNSFIIHWGSKSFGKEPQKYTNIMEINQKKFFDKWSSIRLNSYEYWNIRPELVSLLEQNKIKNDATIMVIGTACGGILSHIQDRFPKAKLFALEENPFLAQMAAKIAETVWTDLNEWKGDDLEEAFDVIIINDSLENTMYPERVLGELVKMLKKEGRIFISFLNRNHYSRMEIRNESARLLDRIKVTQMMQNVKLAPCEWGYTLTENQSQETELRIQQLLQLHPDTSREELSANQWIVTAERQRDDIKFGDKMVVCIPTYEHSEAVEDVLSRCAETYKRYGLDIYYFDSSTDDRTKKVVESYQARGFDNIYYIWLDQNAFVYPKATYVLQLYKAKKKYKYLWYLRDRCWCEEKTLKLMYEATSQSYDLIFMDIGHSGCEHEMMECHNADAFYHRCGDYATSMDTSIYNMDSMLKDAFTSDEFWQGGKDIRIRSLII